jgi:hypothetical protein
MPSIEGSDPATADGEEAQSWGQVPLQRILIGGPPTTTDDLRDLIEPSLRVLTVGRCDHRLKPPSPSRSDTARGMTHWRRLRDWNDARCSTNSTNCRSLAAAPTEPAWFGWVHVLQLGHEVPYRGAFRAQLRPNGRALQPKPGEDRLGAQALQAARQCVTQGLQGAGQSLRCTTRVTRSSARLICQRHRGSTRPGPRPRPASSGAPAPTAVCWLTPLPG